MKENVNIEKKQDSELRKEPEIKTKDIANLIYALRDFENGFESIFTKNIKGILAVNLNEKRNNLQDYYIFHITPENIYYFQEHPPFNEKYEFEFEEGTLKLNDTEKHSEYLLFFIKTLKKIASDISNHQAFLFIKEEIIELPQEPEIQKKPPPIRTAPLNSVNDLFINPKLIKKIEEHIGPPKGYLEVIKPETYTAISTKLATISNAFSTILEIAQHIPPQTFLNRILAMEAFLILGYSYTQPTK